MTHRLPLFVALFFSSGGAIGQSAGLVVDEDGRVAGAYADQGMVHSHTGFRFRINFHTGRVAYPLSGEFRHDDYAHGLITDISGAHYGPHIHYESDDCSGVPYVEVCVAETCVPSGATRAAGGVVMDTRGSQFTDPDQTYALFYVPRHSAIEQVEVQSIFQGVCSLSPRTIQAVPLVPNDPSVTGVPDVKFSPPLRLEMRPFGGLFDLFKDGFESSKTVSIRGLAARGRLGLKA